ncbi:MAG: ATP-grasp domain-containing protein, partial [Elusimicrobia bacterium]|nr:ATP-grasp domain-containing protein [Elusimicrobiota bacterium]
MKKNVLVICSGGVNKYGYLEWLVKLGANVILLEPESKRGKYSKHSWTTFYAPFDDISSLIKLAARLHSKYNFAAVDTIFELTMEHAAQVRKALGISGIAPELLRYGRNKTIMAEFMRENGIRTAPFIVFDQNDDLRKIQNKMQKSSRGQWILKADNLGANIGVRRMKNPGSFIKAFKSAQKDISDNPYGPIIYYETGKKWLVCRFIDGHEIETEVCVHNGKVIFSCYLFKTISVEREQGIEENRYITPPPWLTKRQLKDLDRQIQNIGRAVWKNVMKPCGKQTLVLHPEFRIDKQNHAYTLEFAFRNGGGLNPYRIKESTGIDPYYLSACATLGIKPKTKLRRPKKASGYQMLFSDRKGIYEGVRGIKKIKGIEIKPEVKKGYKISVPHAEPLVSIIVSAPTPEKVARYSDPERQASLTAPTPSPRTTSP